MYRIPFGIRIAISTALIVGAVLVVTEYLDLRTHGQMLLEAISEELSSTVRNVQARLDTDDVALQTPEALARIKRLLDEFEYENPLEGEFRLLTLEGDTVAVIASSDREVGSTKYYGGRSEVARAAKACFKRHTLLVTPLYEDGGALWISALSPIRDSKGTFLAVLTADRPATEYETLHAAAKRRAIIYLALMLAGSTALGILLSLRVTRPLRRLYGAALALREGRFEPVEVVGNDEVAELSRNFNETQKILQQKIQELELLNRELEQRVVARTEQLSRSYEELRDRQQVIQREMSVARRIQETIIPRSIHRERINIEVEYIPILEIGGDLGLAIEQSPDTFDVAVGDVTGHGIGAALVVNRAHALLGELYRTRAPLDALFHRVDYYLSREVADIGIFMTMFACRFHFDTMELEFGGAGHPPALLSAGEGAEPEELSCRCGILGIGDIYCDVPPVGRRALKGGEVAVLYTDGLVDAIGPDGRTFGQARLKEALKLAVENHSDTRAIARSLVDAAKNFTAGYFQDDVLVLVVEVK